MSDIQCGAFHPFSVDADGMIRWSATLTPIPDDAWETTFHAEAAMALERGLNLGRALAIRSDALEFSAPETAEEPITIAIRDVLSKANGSAVEDGQALNRRREVERQRREDNATQLQRLREKYPGGL
jgi:hypothetical protein